MKRMVEGNKKQEGILIFPKVYTQTGTCSCLPEPFFFFFLELVLGKINSASRDNFYRAYLQIKSQLHEHFYQSQESQIPGRFAFYVSALIFLKDLCTRLRLVYVIKMFHLRLRKWLIPLCSMASVSGKKMV